MGLEPYLYFHILWEFELASRVQFDLRVVEVD